MDKKAIKKYLIDIDNGNYLTSKNGKNLSSDYTKAYLFTDADVKNIKSLYKKYCNEYDAELCVSEVRYDFDFAEDVRDKLMRESRFLTFYGFWESKDMGYGKVLIQKYIEKCTKYDQLVTKIAKDIAGNYAKLFKQIIKQFPNKRSFEEIVKDIRSDWKRIPKDIKEYLYVMNNINDSFDFYIWGKGRYEVFIFLNESDSWQGETANRIKLELTAMLNSDYIPKKQPSLYYIVKESKGEAFVCDNQLKCLTKYDIYDIADYFLITEKESKTIKKELGRKAVYGYDEDLVKGKYNIFPIDIDVLHEYLNECTWNDDYQMYLPINPDFQQEMEERFDTWDLYYEDVVCRCLQKTRIAKALAAEIESTIKHDESMWSDSE